MGNRISVSFYSEDGEESVALFSHWGGKEFLNKALKYLKNLKKELGNDEKKIIRPLDRLEPSVVMVDFIREITKDMKRVEDDLYLGKDPDDGDNSDNGHFSINVDTEEIA